MTATLGFLLAVLGADPGDGLMKKMMPLYRQDAEAYSLSLAAEPETKARLKKEPVMEWVNPARGDTQGVIFLWTRDGLPTAVGGVFSYPDGDKDDRVILHELHSLDTERIAVKRPPPEKWAPEGGLKRYPLPEAAPPGNTGLARRLQLRKLAREFGGYSVDLDGNRLKLTTQATPLYRYPEAEDGVIDGALFAITSEAGTDPEVLLLIEAVKGPDGLNWRYACGRFSDHELHASRKGKEVFTYLRKEGTTAPEQPGDIYRVIYSKTVKP